MNSRALVIANAVMLVAYSASAYTLLELLGIYTMTWRTVYNYYYVFLANRSGPDPSCVGLTAETDDKYS